MKFPSRVPGSRPPVFDYTVVLGKLCHKMCWISWVLPSKVVGICDKKHLFCLPSACVLPSFEKAIPWSSRAFWKQEILWESQMMCRDGWLQPEGSGARRGLAHAKTAQGSYSTGVHGDGRGSFLETRWDQAQFSESRSWSESFPTRTQLVGRLLLINSFCLSSGLLFSFLCLRSVIIPVGILKTNRLWFANNKEKI